MPTLLFVRFLYDGDVAINLQLYEEYLMNSHTIFYSPPLSR